jgi:hypothetical protein
MKEDFAFSSCSKCVVSRRGFIAAGCAACAGATGLFTSPSRSFAAAEGGKLKLQVIYALHAVKQPGPDWPNVGFDFAPVMERISNALNNALPDIEFLTSTAAGPEEAAKILESSSSAGVDGYIVYQMNAWNKVVQTFAKSGKPVLFADFQFGGSGGFLVYTSTFIRDKASNVGFVASSNIDDFIAAVRCFQIVKNGGTPADFAMAVAKLRVERTPGSGDLSCAVDHVKTVSTEKCLKRLKKSKILAVRDEKSGPADPVNGIPLEMVGFAEVNDAWKAANKDESRAVADRWRKAACKIEDVSDETLLTSAAMYLGMKAVLKKHNANAITINCLGGFYGGHIHAYPCLGFHELCNEGLIGACECDIRSTGTMVAINALTNGRPGYISDPVLDTASRRIIYAHCVASNYPFGPKGKKNAFEILTHSEDRQGASVRSILPEGFMTTTVELSTERKEMLFHQAKVVGNDPDDRACRTKLVGDPIGDFEKLFTQWDQWSWHRVTAYGDLKEPLFALADALGYKVIQEA